MWMAIYRAGREVYLRNLKVQIYRWHYRVNACDVIWPLHNVIDKLLLIKEDGVHDKGFAESIKWKDKRVLSSAMGRVHRFQEL